MCCPSSFTRKHTMLGRLSQRNTGIVLSPQTGLGRTYEDCLESAQGGQVHISHFTPQTSTQQLSELCVREECDSPVTRGSLPQAERLLASQDHRKPKIVYSSGNVACRHHQLMHVPSTCHSLPEHAHVCIRVPETLLRIVHSTVGGVGREVVLLSNHCLGGFLPAHWGSEPGWCPTLVPPPRARVMVCRAACVLTFVGSAQTR